MADSTTSSDKILGSTIVLDDLNVAVWKRKVQEKALTLGAWFILIGEESLGRTDRSKLEYLTLQSKIAGHIRSTLTEGHLAILDAKGIDIIDAKGIWDTILAELESKSVTSQYYAFMDLLGFKKREDETYGDYCVGGQAAANKLRRVIPKGATYTRELINTGGTTTSDVWPTSYIASTFDKGFSAEDLIESLTIAIIIAGLGQDPLAATLTQIGIKTIQGLTEKCRDHDKLKAAAELHHTGETALVSKSTAPKAQRPSPSTPSAPKHCSRHPNATSHSTEDCTVLKREIAEAKQVKKDKAKKKKAKAQAKAAKEPNLLIPTPSPPLTPILRRLPPRRAEATWPKQSVHRPRRSTTMLTRLGTQTPALPGI